MSDNATTKMSITREQLRVSKLTMGQMNSYKYNNVEYNSEHGEEKGEAQRACEE